MRKNGFKISIGKTTEVLFTEDKKKFKIVDSAKFPGSPLTRLSWGPFVEYTIHSFITVRLDCCCSLYVGLPACRSGCLDRVLRTAARLCGRIPKFGHVSAYMLDVLHWLPLLQRISYRIIALFWRSLLGLAPAYLRDLCCPTLSAPGRRSLRSTERCVLMVPFARTATKQNCAFSVVGPSLWNGLLLALRLHPRIHSESFYSCLFQPYWGRKRPWVVTLKGRYINLRNEWMNHKMQKDAKPY